MEEILEADEPVLIQIRGAGVVGVVVDLVRRRVAGVAVITSPSDDPARREVVRPGESSDVK